MSRTVSPYGKDARVGMILQSQFPTSRIEHVITDVTQDYETLKYDVTTNQGRWQYSAHEALVFPRRDLGRIVDWITADRLPVATELCVGDLLPPNESHPSLVFKDFNEWPDLQQATVMKMYRDNRQEVRSVSVHPRNESIMRVTCAVVRLNEQANVIRYDFDAATPIIFPRSASTRRPNYVPPKTLKFVAHGPYIGPSGYLMLAQHPTGRGRWPKILDGGFTRFDTSIGSVPIIRPPARNASMHDWALYEFIGRNPWMRHHDDPHWGMETLIAKEQMLDRGDLILTAYREYADSDKS